jgi:hypothetical protein
MKDKYLVLNEYYSIVFQSRKQKAAVDYVFDTNMESIEDGCGIRKLRVYKRVLDTGDE